MAKVLIAVIGINGSGKTTLSEKLSKSLNLNHINGDDFMMFLKQNIAYYHDLDISIPNEKYESVKQFKIEYRNFLTAVLLSKGQPVVFDAVGHKREYRDQYLSVYRQDVDTKLILIWVDILRDELLKRLKERDLQGGSWQKQLEEKGPFEPPEADEADVILRYDQKNYQEIEDRLRELI